MNKNQKLWHSSSEEPEFMKFIIYEYEKGGNKMLEKFILPPYDRKLGYWSRFVKDRNIQRWIYMNDLQKAESIVISDENAKKELTVEDLKKGDFVAFEFCGNTAVVRIEGDDGYFHTAVGLWMDGNLIGVKNATWDGDYMNNVETVDEIHNLRYADVDDIKRYVDVRYGYSTGNNNDIEFDRSLYPSVGDLLSVWHCPEEKPEVDRCLMVHYKKDSDDCFLVTKYSGLYDWSAYSSHLNAVEWLYIDELLPNGITKFD